MGTIKDRTGNDLIEAEGIKKRWKEYTEELYTKDLSDLDNHDSVVSHSESGILECEVKWALGNNAANKSSGGNSSSFKVLKDDAIKVLHSICRQIWKT